MKIQRSKKKISKKKLFIAASIAVVILISGVILAYRIRLWPFQNSKSTQSVTDANNSDSTNDQTKEKSAQTNSNVDITKTTDEITVSTNMSVSITQLTQDGSNVTYSAKVSNPGTSGTCSAIFTNPASQPVTNTTTINGDVCGPVSIPSVQFTALGTWTLTLRYYTNNTQAVDTKTIEIR